VLVQGASELILLAQQHCALLFLQVGGPLQAVSHNPQLTGGILPGSKLTLQRRVFASAGFWRLQCYSNAPDTTRSQGRCCGKVPSMSGAGSAYSPCETPWGLSDSLEDGASLYSRYFGITQSVAPM